MEEREKLIVAAATIRVNTVHAKIYTMQKFHTIVIHVQVQVHVHVIILCTCMVFCLKLRTTVASMRMHFLHAYAHVHVRVSKKNNIISLCVGGHVLCTKTVNHNYSTTCKSMQHYFSHQFSLWEENF